MMRAEKEAGEVKPARKSLSPPKACIDHLSGAGYAPPEHSAKRPCEQGRPDAPARPLPTPGETTHHHRDAFAWTALMAQPCRASSTASRSW